MIFSTIRKMAAGILPGSLRVLYHGERPRRKVNAQVAERKQINEELPHAARPPPIPLESNSNARVLLIVHLLHILHILEVVLQV